MDAKQLDTPAVFAVEIAEKQTALIHAWHTPEGQLDNDAHNVCAEKSEDTFFERLSEQHRRNVLLWHEEDKARVPDAPDAVIAAVKRRIDALNQQRNDRIEGLDDHLQRLLSEKGVANNIDAPWNSETPGSILDRLSILSLKVFHTQIQATRSTASEEHRKKAAYRLLVLQAQRKDLTQALGEILADLLAGKKQMKLYKQYKMYNDPEWNPAVYQAQQNTQEPE